MKSVITITTVAILAFALTSSHANADEIRVFETPGDLLMDGHPAHAKATCTTSVDKVIVELENLQTNPTSVVQNISGLWIKLISGETEGTLISSQSIPRSVAKDDSYSDEAAGPTGWELESGEFALYLHVLGTDVGPAHTLMGGPDAGCDSYSNANGSIAGNKPHNPFLAELATFELEVPGVSEHAFVSGVVFEFGTSPGDTYTDGDPPLIPEPATLSLLALGGLVVLNHRRRRHARG